MEEEQKIPSSPLENIFGIVRYLLKEEKTFNDASLTNINKDAKKSQIVEMIKAASEASNEIT
jgi:hypothetical protein